LDHHQDKDHRQISGNIDHSYALKEACQEDHLEEDYLEEEEDPQCQEDLPLDNCKEEMEGLTNFQETLLPYSPETKKRAKNSSHNGPCIEGSTTTTQSYRTHISRQCCSSHTSKERT
jgi:hypothetical protein